MFKKNPREKTGLENAIDQVTATLLSTDPTSDEYPKLVKQLNKLHKMKMQETSNPVSKDTIALTIGNLVGIGIIVGHERAHLVASKALAFVGKLR